MSSNRFGLICLPIYKLDLAVEGEMLQDPNTGHIYVKKGVSALSKTVDIENRLNVMQDASYYTNLHLLLGNNNWSNMILKPNVSTMQARYERANNGVVMYSNNMSDTDFMINNITHISKNAKYYVSITVKQLSGNGTFSFGVKSLNGTDPNVDINTDGISNDIVTNKSLIVNQEYTFEGVYSGYNNGTTDKSKFDKDASFFVPYISFGKSRTVTVAELLITKFEVFEIPSVLIANSTLVNNADGTLSVLPNADTVRGIKIFSQTTQPTDAESKNNDIWFDLTNKLVRYRSGANTWTIFGAAYLTS